MKNITDSKSKKIITISIIGLIIILIIGIIYNLNLIKKLNLMKIRLNNQLKTELKAMIGLVVNTSLMVFI